MESLFVFTPYRSVGATVVLEGSECDYSPAPGYRLLAFIVKMPSTGIYRLAVSCTLNDHFEKSAGMDRDSLSEAEAAARTWMEPFLSRMPQPTA